MKTPFEVLKSLRWVAIATVITGLAITFLWSILLAVVGSFSPDGPPQGDNPLFRILSVMFVFPMLAVRVLREAPWISRPILGYMIVELLWRYAVPAKRKPLLIEWVRWHATAVLLAIVSCAAIFASYAGYAQRSGPAQFCVFNDSELVCSNVTVEGNGFSLPLGLILPGERRFCVARPTGMTPVSIQCEANGTKATLSFTGGIDDSRENYCQFSIMGDLRGHFGAWRIRDRPASNDIVIRNDRKSTVSNIVVSGLGYIHSTTNLAAGCRERFRVRPMGPAIFTVTYQDANGVRYVQSWRGWGYEGRKLLIKIGDTIDWDFGKMGD